MESFEDMVEEAAGEAQFQRFSRSQGLSEGEVGLLRGALAQLPRL